MLLFKRDWIVPTAPERAIMPMPFLQKQKKTMFMQRGKDDVLTIVGCFGLFAVCKLAVAWHVEQLKLHFDQKWTQPRRQNVFRASSCHQN